MTCRKRHPARWAIGALAALCVVMLLTGCSAPQESDQIQGAGNFDGYGVLYTGETPMDLLILGSDVIARVRFESVKQVVEPYNWYRVNPPFDVYVAALEFKFEVLEYLKGSGGEELQAVAYDADDAFETRAGASGVDLLTLREQRWDNREAIVFLFKSRALTSTATNADRYAMGAAKAQEEDGFTVASRWAKRWLPDAAAQTNEDDGARGTSGSEQRFLLEAPPAQASGATRSAQPSTITLSGLKTRIATLEAEIALGDGTPEYRECVTEKYAWPLTLQRFKDRLEARGRTFAKQFDEEIASGLAAGTPVYFGGDYLILSNESKQTAPANSDKLVVTSGQDADLFAKGWPLTAETARPLPTGTYRFYWAEQSFIDALCDAMPDLHRTHREVVVTVTPPPNTLHEAFFDPVTIGTGVGVDSSNGVLNPASFTVDGTSTSITGLKWESGSVVLSLSPYSSLSGHKLDFIELDGSVGLSLDASSVTEDSAARTLSWSVPDQPWHNDDLLMLRIAASTTPEPTATPEPTPTPTSTPQPTPTPQQTSSVSVSLSPRDDPYITQTDITVSWSDSAPCQGNYFVGVSDSQGYLIRLLGSHPAPATTAIDADLSLPWDNVSNYSWTVSVRCDPSDSSSDWWMLGEVPLQSGLPSSP